MTQKGISIRFFGVRGSLPVPGPATVRTGGNTSCVLYTVGEQVIVLDCGSGMRVLGGHLLARKVPVTAAVLLSHYHWDHLLGLPFFIPIYMPTTELTFYGERKTDGGPAEEIKKQFTGPNFPVERKDLNSKLHFNDIEVGKPFEVGEVHVRPFRVNHPNLCIGYRLECRGTAIVYCTDHEHGTAQDENLIEMSHGADALIYDAMYTKDEYLARARGWGHSTWDEAVKVASAAGVKDLYLFHHEPDRTDDGVDAIEAQATAVFQGAMAAREGFEYLY